jgi:hypothetical protein
MSAIAEADRAKFERILNNKKKTVSMIEHALHTSDRSVIARMQDLAGLLKAQREGTLDEVRRAASRHSLLSHV